MARDIEDFADPESDFREDLERAEAYRFFPELVEALKKNLASRSKKAKNGLRGARRLPTEQFAYLVFECTNTNKTNTQIAKKFGVTQQNVSKLRAKLRKSPEPILYRKNGQLFFDLSGSKESITRRGKSDCGAHCSAFLSAAKKNAVGTQKRSGDDVQS